MIGYTLSQVKDDGADADRRRAVLQGPDAGRAARGARAAARSPRVARRDGGRHRARAEEPARRHRGDGRPAAPPGARLAGRAVAARRHHQRSEAGQRDRRRDARVRAADAAAGRAHRSRRRAAAVDDAGRDRRCRAATSSCTINLDAGPADDRRRSASAVAGVHQPADQRLRGAGRQGRDHDYRQLDRDRGRPGVCRHRTRRRRPSSSKWPTTARASRPSSTDRIFNPFFTTKVTAPASASPSSGRSSTRTTAASTSAARRTPARGSGSRCRSRSASGWFK